MTVPPARVAPHHVCLDDGASVLDAVRRLEDVRVQIVFVTDPADRLLGVVTNGDIRRHLLEGGRIEDAVTRCMNRDYRWARHDSSREELLKLLDVGFNAIPRLDGDGRLVDWVTPQSLTVAAEDPVLVRSRAPVRVSFGGGGSDLTYYFLEQPGAVLSTTIMLYSHVTLVPRRDRVIRLESEDLESVETYASLHEVVRQDRPSSLMAAVVSVVQPGFGFDLYVRSDVPMGSGLGGSSAVTTAIVTAFNELRFDRWSPYEVAELCFQAERLCFGIAGGWQDQYAAAFGGLNLIEFDGSGNRVHPLHLDEGTLHELEECLVLCNTGVAHDSSALHKAQRAAHERADRSAEMREAVELCHQMHRQLARGELLEFGRSLHQAWQLKRGYSSMVSSAGLDRIYDTAVSAGAVGGKLLGAGGGGFFLFFVPPQRRQKVRRALEGVGCTLSPFRFERRGAVAWRKKLL